MISRYFLIKGYTTRAARALTLTPTCVIITTYVVSLLLSKGLEKKLEDEIFFSSSPKFREGAGE
jgi:hypothetical protein